MDQDKNKNIDDSTFQIDPDYESTHTAIRRVELQEVEENKLTEEKLSTIIQEEFDKELQIRQKQLEEIEDKVFKAQKLLHVVRYVLISSYYNNRALEFESSSALELDSNISTGQNRIHPAIKKLLGKNTNNLKFLAARTKRKAAVNKSEALFEPKRIKLEVDESTDENPPTIPLIIVKPEPVLPKLIEEPVTNRKKIQHRLVIGNISYFKRSLEQNNLTHKWMVYVKIFRGSKDGPEITNLAISKVVFHLHPSYKPHDVVDISQPPYHLSRRGWGEFPLRVKIFFKSSMNKPVDVIHQLKLDSTFTERQTLGNQTVVPIFLYDDSLEIPIQEPLLDNKSEDNRLYIKKLNKNITTTTIGNIGSLSIPSSSILNDQIISIEPIKIEPGTSYEHDYCYDNVTIKQEVLDLIDDYLGAQPECDSVVLTHQAVQLEKHHGCLREHAYSLSSDKEGLKSPKKHKSPVKQAYNELIYGLGPHYLDPLRCTARSVRPKIIERVSRSSPDKSPKPVMKVLKTVTNQSIQFLPESFGQVLLTNGSIVPITILKSPPKSMMKKMPDKDVITLEAKLVNSTPHSTKTNLGKSGSSHLRALVRQEQCLLKLPKHAFKNMGEVLPYLFRRLPLWSAQAGDTDYKCTYPFTAWSEGEYLSWNIGKKVAAEWSRAKTIKKIVSGESYSKNWTTKAIFMFARSHLYTPPVPSYRLFEKESPEKRLILNCYQNTGLQNGYLPIPVQSRDEAINITSPVNSVIDSIDSNNSLDSCIDITDKRLSQEFAFIKEASLDVGVILKPEVLVKGVAMNASERIIFEAVKCFAENLIRRSRNYLVCQPNYRNETSEITTEEVKRALENRKEFQSIRTFKENKLTMDFFS